MRYLKGDKYKKGNKEYVIYKVNETQNATYIMLESRDKNATVYHTVGKKVLENEYRRINDER